MTLLQQLAFLKMKCVLPLDCPDAALPHSCGQPGQASCFNMLLFSMLSVANNVLPPALYLLQKHEIDIHLLISL